MADAIERKQQVWPDVALLIQSPTASPAIRRRMPRPTAPEEEVDLWRQDDSLIGYRDYLLTNGHASASDLDAISAEVGDRLVRVLTAA